MSNGYTYTESFRDERKDDQNVGRPTVIEAGDYGLYQCISIEFFPSECALIVSEIVISLIFGIFIAIYLYQSFKFKGWNVRKKNIIFVCLFLANLSFFIYCVSKNLAFSYVTKNLFMNLQMAVTIYYFAAKAFKVTLRKSIINLIKGFFIINILYDFAIFGVSSIMVVDPDNTTQSCKEQTWTYVRIIQMVLSIIFAGLGKYIINQMNEQLKQSGFRSSQVGQLNLPSIVPNPLQENQRQAERKGIEKRNIWLLIICNLVAGITEIVKNFILLYNGRPDCRYISHGSGDIYTDNANDVLNSFLNFLTRCLTYFIPVLVSLVVFRLHPEEMKVFSKEEYFEENFQTPALGIKPIMSGVFETGSPKTSHNGGDFLVDPNESSDVSHHHQFIVTATGPIDSRAVSNSKAQSIVNH